MIQMLFHFSMHFYEKHLFRFIEKLINFLTYSKPRGPREPGSPGLPFSPLPPSFPSLPRIEMRERKLRDFGFNNRNLFIMHTHTRNIKTEKHTKCV